MLTLCSLFSPSWRVPPPAALAQIALPSGSINGATNPDQIPDFVALRLVFAALANNLPNYTAIAGQSPTQPSTKQASAFRLIGLGSADTNVVLQALQAWQRQVSAVLPSPPPNLDVIAQASLNGLEQQMSQQGFAALMSYVRAEKKNMVRVLGPNTTQHNNMAQHNMGQNNREQELED